MEESGVGLTDSLHFIDIVGHSRHPFHHIWRGREREGGREGEREREREREGGREGGRERARERERERERETHTENEKLS